MNREDIIRMAREAGLWEADISKPLFDFAALVEAKAAAAEREACAQAAGPDDSYQDEWFKAKADSVRRIRARGQA